MGSCIDLGSSSDLLVLKSIIWTESISGRYSSQSIFAAKDDVVFFGEPEERQLHIDLDSQVHQRTGVFIDPLYHFYSPLFVAVLGFDVKKTTAATGKFGPNALEFGRKRFAEADFGG